MKIEEYNILYEENISFKWIWLAVVVFIVLDLSFTALLLYQELIGYVGQKQLPVWFYPIMLAVFTFSTLLLLSSRKLKIRMSTKGLQVGISIFKTYLPYENIGSCSLDERSSLYYGGLGIRTSMIRGKWVTAYNIGGKRIVISYKDRNKFLVFSTKNPEKILGIVKEYAALKD